MCRWSVHFICCFPGARFVVILLARLFIGPREQDFISDIVKEITKDVIGQKIFYYSINETKTRVHDVYLEAPDKVFEQPIELDALVEFKKASVRTGQFGSETVFDISAYVQRRDLLDKGVQLAEGDFFSYGRVFFEIVKLVFNDVIYGEVEYLDGYEILGKEARRAQFVTKLFGPTDEAFLDADATQQTFVQQRGFAENKNGPTGDVRALHEKGVTEKGLTGPKEVSPRGGAGDASTAGSSFYDE